MPVVRKLSDHDIRPATRTNLGQRKATELAYDRSLADFAPGDYGEVTPEAGENRLTVRNRLKAAAARRTPPLALVFLRTRGETMRFSVEAAEAVPDTDGRAVAPVPTTTAPEPAEEEPIVAADLEVAPRRRGRPRRQASAAATVVPTAAPTPPEQPKPRRSRRTASGA